jgi:hypothetical protein
VALDMETRARSSSKDRDKNGTFAASLMTPEAIRG